MNQDQIQVLLDQLASYALDAAGISIPFPQRDVHLYRTSESGLKDSD